MAVERFHWADYLVFALNLLVSASIGFFHGFIGKQKTTKDFLVGGRNMKPLPVALSLLASFLSAPFLVGTPAEMYCFGTMYSYFIVGNILGAIITVYCFVPLFHSLELTSAYEYLEARFSKKVRLIGSIIFSLNMIMYMAIVIYAPSVSFSQVTGMPTWVTILATGLVCTFYTSVGGMKAVVWADVVQMIIIMVVAILLVILGSVKAGGFGLVFEKAYDGGRIIFNDFNPDPTVRHTFWTQSIGAMFLVSCILASNQVTIQRYLSIEKLEDAKKSVVYGLVVMIFCLALVCTLGLVLYATYETCDPLMSRRVAKADQLIPYFVMEILGHMHGMPGLFAAAVFSATLSTVSSGLNALAAVILIDMIKPAYQKIKGFSLNEETATKVSKILAATLGLVVIGLAYLAPYLGKTLLAIAISIFGMVGGPLLGLFSLAIFFPMCNEWGALAGMAASLIMSFWVGIGMIVNPSFPKLLPLRVDGCPSPTALPSNMTYLTTEATSTLASLMMTTATSMTSAEEVVAAAPAEIPEKFWLYRLSYMWLSCIAVISAVVVAIPVSYLTGANKGRDINPKYMFNYAQARKDIKRKWDRYICCRGVDEDDLSESDIADKELESLLQEQHTPQPLLRSNRRRVASSKDKAMNGVNGVINGGTGEFIGRTHPKHRDVSWLGAEIYNDKHYITSV